jgi:Domain of unknown function (DUF222)
MSSNTDSIEGAGGLEHLAAVVEELAGEELAALPAAAAARRVLVLRGLLERLEGQWLRELAAVDARGAAGAEDDTQADGTAGWLRRRLRAGATQASGWVRMARALFRGPLAETGKALAAGELSAAHAAVLAGGTQDLPPATAAQAEPVLLQAARRLDPPRLRRLVAHLGLVADPDGAAAQARRRHEQRGLWVSATFAGMVAVDGCWSRRRARRCWRRWNRWPPTTADARSAPQRRADALAELARRALEGGRLPQTGGVRPQLTVTIELAGLLGDHPTPGGEGGWTGSLSAATCRRLACDAAVTRAIVTRPRQQRRRRWPRRPGQHAAGGGGAATGGAGRRPRPAVGGRPRHPGGVPRPAHRAGGARRRLCGPGL